MLAGFDFETGMILPGLLVPDPVCAGVVREGSAPRTLLREEALDELGDLLAGGWTICGANWAFDAAVACQARPALLREVLRAYDEGRVWDVLIAQALDAIARGCLMLDPRTGLPLRGPDGKVVGRYSLAVVADLVLGKKDAKAAGEFWRTRYGLLAGVPIAEWPADAVKYPQDDAVNALDIAKVQLVKAQNYACMVREAWAAFALHVGAAWGIRVDAEALKAYESDAEARHAERQARFEGEGFLRADGTENLAAVRRAVAIAYGARMTCSGCGGRGKIASDKTGKPVGCRACSATGLDLSLHTLPRTAKGGLRADRDALVESGSELLAEYGDDAFEKGRTTYAPFLRAGVDVPLNLRPNVLVSSFRTSYSGPIQQMPRKDGARACVVPRPGRVFCSCDYSSIELCTLAQSCLWLCGQSEMAKALNAGLDLHSAFGASMLGIAYDEFRRRVKAGDRQAKDFRQAAKAANFGFPGGMGAAKLALAKRRGAEGSTTGPDGRVWPGIRFCLLLGGAKECGSTKVTEWPPGRPQPPVCEGCCRAAQDLRTRWFRQWPEMEPYFAHVTAVSEGVRRIIIPDGAIGSRRGGVGFCDGANGYFQGLAAIGGKEALRDATRECLLGERPDGTPSALAGSRVVFFVHDECFAEMPEEKAAEAGPRLAEVMVVAMSRRVPDVKIAVEPALMRRWQKDAEPTYRDGRLIPWEDR